MSARHEVHYLPTPTEIARACASIRSRWTPRERQRRRAGTSFFGAMLPEASHRPWQPPVIDTAVLRLGSGKPMRDLIS